MDIKATKPRDIKEQLAVNLIGSLVYVQYRLLAKVKLDLSTLNIDARSHVTCRVYRVQRITWKTKQN